VGVNQHAPALPRLRLAFVDERSEFAKAGARLGAFLSALCAFRKANARRRPKGEGGISMKSMRQLLPIPAKGSAELVQIGVNVSWL
jgi:hypothetical protein